MTSRDLVIRTLNHEPVDRVPRDLWYSPGVETLRADEVAEIEVRSSSADVDDGRAETPRADIIAVRDRRITLLCVKAPRQPGILDDHRPRQSNQAPHADGPERGALPGSGGDARPA